MAKIDSSSTGATGMAGDTATSATSKTITPEMISTIGVNLNQIGNDMLSIQSLLSLGDFDHIDAAIEVLAMRSGALADSISAQIGNHGCVGNFSEWFNPNRV